MSPLLWLLLVNRIPQEVGREMRKELPEAQLDEEMLLQLFADGISAAISADTEEEVIERAFILVKILKMVLENRIETQPGEVSELLNADP